MQYDIRDRTFKAARPIVAPTRREPAPLPDDETSETVIDFQPDGQSTSQYSPRIMQRIIDAVKALGER